MTLGNDAYMRALGTAGRLVAAVPPGALDDPTPCAKWAVADLLNHFIQVARLTANAAQGHPFDPAVFDTDYTNGDMLAAYNDATRASIEAFARPGALERTVQLPVIGEVSGEVARVIHFTDTVTHTWDLARALGRDPGIDNDVAELALHYAHIHYRGMPRGPDSPFLADEVAIGATASATDRLVAYLGRDPSA